MPIPGYKQVGGQWFGLAEVGVRCRNSAQWTSFEARRGPGNPFGDMEYLHICRPCAYSGGIGSLYHLRRPVVRIAKFAYSDSLDSAQTNDSPAELPLGENASIAPLADTCLSPKYWKGVLAVVIAPLAVVSEDKADLRKFSLKKARAGACRSTSTFAIDNVALLSVSVEGGVIDCLSPSLWCEGAGRFSRCAGFACYFALPDPFGAAEGAYVEGRDRIHTWF